MPQLNRDILARALLLLGFFVLLLFLIMTNQLTLYVNPKVTNLIKISAGLLFIMFLLQCWHLKKSWTESKNQSHNGGGYWRYSPFVLVLLIALLLPNTSLSASLVQNKGLNSQITGENSKGAYRPLAAELQQTNFIKVSDQNFIEVMSEIYHYPQEYAGKEIDIKGFVFKDASKSPDQFSLVRYVVGCCVADASAYGPLCEIKDADQYPDGSWYQIQGIIEMREQQGKNFPVIKITWIKQTNAPLTPYVFPQNQ